MSLYNGYAGVRGYNPVGVFIHNDGGSQNANTKFYKGWLPTRSPDLGYAHAYIADDGILFAEEDKYCAYHCGQSDGNTNYYSIEVCQSLGDEKTFLKNEDNAFKLAAEKCKLYGIIPSSSTIKLHREVYATSCPHRSVEIHGNGTKQYFIDKIKGHMKSETTEPNKPSKPVETNKLVKVIEEEDEMKCFYTVDGKAPVIYFDGTSFRKLGHPDEVTILNKIYKECTGRDIPCYSWQSIAPWYVRLQAVFKEERKIVLDKK